jgi:hypothetical protein
MALETINEYIDDGRVLLQDLIPPHRYSDESLIVAMNVTILEARRIRPDLFVYHKRSDGSYGVQQFQKRDGTIFRMEEQFRLAFVHGLVAHALERDQEDIQDARASTFMQIFNNILTGHAPAPAAAAGA